MTSHAQTWEICCSSFQMCTTVSSATSVASSHWWRATTGKTAWLPSTSPRSSGQASSSEFHHVTCCKISHHYNITDLDRLMAFPSSSSVVALIFLASRWYCSSFMPLKPSLKRAVDDNSYYVECVAHVPAPLSWVQLFDISLTSHLDYDNIEH